MSFASWRFYSLVDCTKGTDSNQRVGDSVYLKKLEVMLTIQPNNIQLQGTDVTPSTTGKCRIVIYKKYRPDGVVPLYSDYFNQDDFQSLRSVPNRARGSLLRDYMHIMTPISKEPTDAQSVLASFTVSGDVTFQWTLYPRCKVQYVGSGAIPIVNDIGIGICADQIDCCNVQWRRQMVFNDV